MTNTKKKSAFYLFIGLLLCVAIFSGLAVAGFSSVLPVAPAQASTREEQITTKAEEFVVTVGESLARLVSDHEGHASAIYNGADTYAEVMFKVIKSAKDDAVIDLLETTNVQEKKEVVETFLTRIWEGEPNYAMEDWLAYGVASLASGNDFGWWDDASRTGMTTVLNKWKKAIAAHLCFKVNEHVENTYGTEARDFLVQSSPFYGIATASSFEPNPTITAPNEFYDYTGTYAELDGYWLSNDLNEIFDYLLFSIMYEVTFDYNDGSTPDLIESVFEGQNVPEPQLPIRENHIFDGWRLETTDGDRFDFTQAIDQSITLVARWIEISPVQYSLGGLESIDGLLVDKQDYSNSQSLVISFDGLVDYSRFNTLDNDGSFYNFIVEFDLSLIGAERFTTVYDLDIQTISDYRLSIAEFNGGRPKEIPFYFGEEELYFWDSSNNLVAATKLSYTLEDYLDYYKTNFNDLVVSQLSEEDNLYRGDNIKNLYVEDLYNNISVGQEFLWADIDIASIVAMAASVAEIEAALIVYAQFEDGDISYGKLRGGTLYDLRGFVANFQQLIDKANELKENTDRWNKLDKNSAYQSAEFESVYLAVDFQEYFDSLLGDILGRCKDAYIADTSLTEVQSYLGEITNIIGDTEKLSDNFDNLVKRYESFNKDSYTSRISELNNKQYNLVDFIDWHDLGVFVSSDDNNEKFTAFLQLWYDETSGQIFTNVYPFAEALAAFESGLLDAGVEMLSAELEDYVQAYIDGLVLRFGEAHVNSSGIKSLDFVLSDYTVDAGDFGSNAENILDYYSGDSGEVKLNEILSDIKEKSLGEYKQIIISAIEAEEAAFSGSPVFESYTETAKKMYRDENEYYGKIIGQGWLWAAAKSNIESAANFDEANQYLDLYAVFGAGMVDLDGLTGGTLYDLRLAVAELNGIYGRLQQYAEDNFESTPDWVGLNKVNQYYSVNLQGYFESNLAHILDLLLPEEAAAAYADNRLNQLEGAFEESIDALIEATLRLSAIFDSLILQVERLDIVYTSTLDLLDGKQYSPMAVAFPAAVPAEPAALTLDGTAFGLFLEGYFSLSGGSLMALGKMDGVQNLIAGLQAYTDNLIIAAAMEVFLAEFDDYVAAYLSALEAKYGAQLVADAGIDAGFFLKQKNEYTTVLENAINGDTDNIIPNVFQAAPRLIEDAVAGFDGMINTFAPFVAEYKKEFINFINAADDEYTGKHYKSWFADALFEYVNLVSTATRVDELEALKAPIEAAIQEVERRIGVLESASGELNSYLTSVTDQTGHNPADFADIIADYTILIKGAVSEEIATDFLLRGKEKIDERVAAIELNEAKILAVSDVQTEIDSLEGEGHDRKDFLEMMAAYIDRINKALSIGEVDAIIAEALGTDNPAVEGEIRKRAVLIKENQARIVAALQYESIMEIINSVIGDIIKNPQQQIVDPVTSYLSESDKTALIAKIKTEIEKSQIAEEGIAAAMDAVRAYIASLEKIDYTLSRDTVDKDFENAKTAFTSSFNSIRGKQVELDATEASHVIELISKLHPKSSEEEIKAARAAYDALSQRQKNLVTNYDHLLDIENPSNLKILVWATIGLLVVLFILAIVILVIVLRKKNSGGDDDFSGEDKSEQAALVKSYEQLSTGNQKRTFKSTERLLVKDVEDIMAMDKNKEEDKNEYEELFESGLENNAIIQTVTEQIYDPITEPMVESIINPDEESEDYGQPDALLSKAEIAAGSAAKNAALPLVERLSITSIDNKYFYSTIKNQLLSFRNVKSRMTKTFEKFSFHRDVMARISLVGKHLRVYLPLDPDAYDVKDYHHKNVGDKLKYQDTPLMLKIKSEKNLAKVVELIEDVMSQKELDKRRRFEEVDYVKMYRNPSYCPLGAIGLGHLMVDEVTKDQTAAISDYEAGKCIAVKGGAAVSRPVRQTVELGVISDNFKSGERVDLKQLLKKELVEAGTNIIKIGSEGRLDKVLTVVADSFEAGAAKMIALTGGVAVRLKRGIKEQKE